MKETQTASPTPEQLLRLVETQLHEARSQRSHRSRHRSAILAGGVLMIVVLAGIALLVLQNLLLDLSQRQPRSSSAVEEPAQPGKF